MSQDLPEPAARQSSGKQWRRWAHAALDQLLDEANLHRHTGRLHITVDVNEGGPRGIRTGTDLILKNQD